ncbi:CDP-alcohol phosphatidyltransferase family protein [Nitrosospira multiformis]|uniref:Phosphatidylglycerophosphate synthase n=1 Tax=Nitrosospira multiformis TaxID=1231 RepID=A0A1I7FFQ8_9PROT|nr:CDP-alcohol phosphatidyltransferase family protein [Nitrosospira multiformis]SFU34998.1 Phosphatidylglycerophosphate synthase [Nitrosospira multiformis]
MPVYIHIIGDSETDIWGLSGRERLQRMLKAFSGTRRVDNPARIPAPAPALLLRGDYLFDAIVLGALIKARTDLVLVSEEGEPVAVRISGANVQQGFDEFARGGEGQTLSSLLRYELKDLDLPSLRQNLKKRDAPYVLPISRNSRCNLESDLFDRSYKGVTDFVTKWLWPAPAFRAVRFCIRAGLQPNHITLLSLLFAVLAGIAFWYGFYGLGLVMGWFMTFLDTVDGKLARVTVTSSRFGDVLDHGLDIIHPPLWYMAWGMGVSADYSLSSHLPLLFGLILIGYIGGRLCEGAFQFWVASFDIFIWRPLDSFNRLITARRNPNLVLLTLGWLAGRPDIGLLSVVIWHLLSTGFLSVRVAMGWLSRRSRGPLHSWFEEIVAGQDEGKLAVRIFVPLRSRR